MVGTPRSVFSSFVLCMDFIVPETQFRLTQRAKGRTKPCLPGVKAPGRYIHCSQGYLSSKSSWTYAINAWCQSWILKLSQGASISSQHHGAIANHETIQLMIWNRETQDPAAAATSWLVSVRQTAIGGTEV